MSALRSIVHPMRWPDRIKGDSRMVGPAARCVDCAPDASAKTYLTICSYGGRHLCILHARERSAEEKGGQ